MHKTYRSNIGHKRHKVKEREEEKEYITDEYDGRATGYKCMASHPSPYHCHR